MNAYLSYDYIFFALSVLLLVSLFVNYKLYTNLKAREAGDALLIKNAYFNDITQLPNRTNVEIMIKDQIDRSTRHNKPFLIATITFVNYEEKRVVDFSNIIANTIRNEDTLAHIEKNVFLILFNEYLEDKNFIILRKRLQNNIAKEKKYVATIGKSIFPADANSVLELIDMAKKQIQ